MNTPAVDTSAQARALAVPGVECATPGDGSAGALARDLHRLVMDVSAPLAQRRQALERAAALPPDVRAALVEGLVNARASIWAQEFEALWGARGTTYNSIGEHTLFALMVQEVFPALATNDPFAMRLARTRLASLEGGALRVAALDGEFFSLGPALLRLIHGLRTSASSGPAGAVANRARDTLWERLFANYTRFIDVDRRAAPEAQGPLRGWGCRRVSPTHAEVSTMLLKYSQIVAGISRDPANPAEQGLLERATAQLDALRR